MDYLLFMKRFLTAPGRVGSPVPSSHHLAERVARCLPWERCATVAELGPGTGSITEALVRRLPRGARLLLFEADPDFRSRLEKRYPDYPMYPDAGQLREALSQLGLKEVSAVVSGIPFTVIPPRQRAEILSQIRSCLAQDGCFVAYQFTPSLYVQVQRYFPKVQVQFVPWNLPPMMVLRCTN